MDKVFQIMVVFALLMLVIVYSYGAREKKYRDYYLFKRSVLPLTGDPQWDRFMTARAEPETGREGVTEAAGETNPETGAAATDEQNQLSFTPGAGATIIVSDLTTGEALATIGLAEPADILLFHSSTRLLYACSREGALTIIRQAGSDRYKIMQRLLVPKGCHSMSLDPQTGKIYLPVDGMVWIYANA